MKEVTIASRPVRTATVVWRREEDEVLVFDPETARLASLNGTASFLWESFDGKKDIDEIAESGAEKFDVDKGALLGDIKKFVQELFERGLIQV